MSGAIKMNFLLRPLAQAFSEFSRQQCRTLISVDRATIYNLYRNVGGQPLHRESMEFRDITSDKVQVNGVDLHYDITGTGNNVLLCLPGMLGSSSVDFKNQLLGFSKEMFTVVGLDPRGYGRSIPPQRDWPEHFLHRDMEDAAQFMKNLGFNKYSVLGWSDGGIVGLMLAARYREHVDNLVIWGAAAFVSEGEMEQYEKLRNIDNWSEATRAPLVAMYGEDYLRKNMNAWVDAFRTYLTKRGGDICRAELTKIRCPTLVLHGEKDPLVPRSHPDFLVQQIMNAQLELYPEAKHNLHQRYYKKFNSDVSHFILTH